ncbi:hypothetical protein ABI59_12380 [Acidobacteria bacterium Mor1]|nr:hypothetical protein ABI59_12380 [Acidobacteria bacterium Mor1]
MDPVRFAVIGCGRIAQAHFDAIEACDEAVVAAVVEPRESAGRAFAEKHGCPWYPDINDATFWDCFDAAVVCSPPNTHREIAGELITRGKHVLCEKPLTIRAERARELSDLAERHQCTLMMASKFRYVEDVVEAKALLESGALGTVVLYENGFCAPVQMAGRWNANPAVSGGGVLIDNGSHSVDIARYLLGPFVDVKADAALSIQGLPVEDTIRLRFRSAGGVLGSVDLSWSLTKDTDYYIRIYGSEGELQVGWKGSRFRRQGAEWNPFGSGYDKNAAFQAQLKNFIAVQRDEAEPLIRPEDAVAAVEIIEKAYQSVRHDASAAVEVA